MFSSSAVSIQENEVVMTDRIESEVSLSRIQSRCYVLSYRQKEFKDLDNNNNNNNISSISSPPYSEDVFFCRYFQFHRNPLFKSPLLIYRSDDNTPSNNNHQNNSETKVHVWFEVRYISINLSFQFITLLSIYNISFLYLTPNMNTSGR